ncbi:unnamed protein product [Boreogadus saida]
MADITSIACLYLFTWKRERPRIVARISRLDTNYRRSISASERLSICLRYLATGDSYRTIANSFRVGISTVSSIVPDVATAIWDSLVEEFMAVPSTDEWRTSCGGPPPPSALRGNIPVGEVDPLPGLRRVAANNSAREAIRIREAFTSYFSAEGTVLWQDNV